MRIEANGIEVHYEMTGVDGAPVVMLSHSLGSSIMMWEPQLRSLERGYRVLCYDTRGHGGSEAPEGPYTLELLVEDAVRLLDALGIEAVHWVGLSLGGMLGQGLALAYPDRLRSLVLCDTAAALPAGADAIWQERIDTARSQGMETLVEATMERWFTAAYRRLNPVEVERFRRQFLDTSVAGYVGCSEAIRGLEYLERLSGIRTPTLIIVGEDDPGTPVSASEAIHERIPGSRLVVLPSAAHLSNVEQPEAFNRTLLDFLRECD